MVAVGKLETLDFCDEKNSRKPNINSNWILSFCHNQTLEAWSVLFVLYVFHDAVSR